MFEFMRKQVEAKKARSAWDKGVKLYALEIIDEMIERSTWDNDFPANAGQLKRWALNGAADWMQYSEGGCALIYDRQIAERLCTATELKHTDNGRKSPNASENWIECQARALYQAALLVRSAFRAAQQILSQA
jgi:hypothetical protein